MGLSSIAREVAAAAPSREGCAERRRRWQKAGAAALGLGRDGGLERRGAAAERRCAGAAAEVRCIRVVKRTWMKLMPGAHTA